MFRLKEILLVVILILTLTSVMLGQTQQQLPLQNRAKLKTIKYKNFGYAIVGYVANKQFVEGQKISFLKTKQETGIVPLLYVAIPYTKTTLTDTITSGIYVTKDGISYLEFTVVKKNDWKGKGSITKGLYKVANSKYSNSLTTIPADASDLKIETADIYFYQGYYDNYPMDNIPVILQKQSEDYVLKMEFDDRILETVVSSENIKNYGFFEFNNLIKYSQNVKLNYKNGDAFIGVVEKDDSKYTAKKGEFKFKTGEIYKGEFVGRNMVYRNGRIFVPDKGETIFADGTTANGDWLKQYDFTDNEWEQIYENRNSLTEIRDNAVRADKEKQQKLQAENIAKQQAQEKKKIAEQKRKQLYIDKYGEYYGSLISEGQLEVGMSQAMVSEVWNKVFFVVSKSIRNGKTIEFWEYSKDKMQMAILLEGAKNKNNGGGEAAFAEIYMMGLSEQFGGPTVPKTIIFTNNKLTDIYR